MWDNLKGTAAFAIVVALAAKLIWKTDVDMLAVGMWAASLAMGGICILTDMKHRAAILSGLFGGVAAWLSFPSYSQIAATIVFAVVTGGLCAYVEGDAHKWPYVSGGLRDDPDLRARYPLAALQSDMLTADEVSRDRRN